MTKTISSNLIILIEDDPIQSETIRYALQKRFRGIEIVVVETESDFRTGLSGILGAKRPKAVVSDVMLPWCHPSPESLPAPKEVIKGTFRSAGTRCHDWFRKQFEDVLWVYFTVLDEETIGFKKHSNQFTRYAQKSGSLDSLVKQIEEFYRVDQSWNETPEGLIAKLSFKPSILDHLQSQFRIPWEECIALP